MTTVAALFVDEQGVYSGLPDVEVWGILRDARLYTGPWPVVAHPPCQRWSRCAGWVEARFGLKRGDDGGCFASALAAVRTYGGVLEHPEASAAWSRYDLPKPQWNGGWTHSLTDAGASCFVEQGRYGHISPKGTWLYAYGVELPELRWGVGFIGRRLDSLSSRDPRRAGTPPEFRDVLLQMARTAHVVCPVDAKDAA